MPNLFRARIFTLGLLVSGLMVASGLLFSTHALEVPIMPTDTKTVSDGLLRKQAHGDMDTVWARLLDAIKATKAPIFSIVDHKANAQGVGLDMTGARVITFGNPAIGTALMQTAPEAALDLPLRILVWESPNGVIISWNDPAWIARRHGINPSLEAITKIRGLLETLSTTAAG